ncbi:MAG: hypothetical protein ACI9UK_000538 [Candidatus Krumholzibacteriia bacterium]|jgi:hypothetical protein
MNRRHFMGSLAAISAATSLGLGGFIVSRRRMALPDITSAAVKPLANCSISLAAPDGCNLRGVVEKVTTKYRPTHGDAPAIEQISILVATHSTGEAKAGFYHVKTDEIDLGTLNFQSVAGVGESARLEAVINRIV